MYFHYRFSHLLGPLIWNLRARILKSRVRVNGAAYLGDKYFLMRANDSNSQVVSHFCLSGMQSMYLQHGLTARGIDLYESYGLGRVDLSANDIFIDVGANSGDVLLALNVCVGSKSIRYFGFEPGIYEFAALQQNYTNCKELGVIDSGGGVNCVAIGAYTGSATFFYESENANSSLIEPPDYSTKVMTTVITLDDALLPRLAPRETVKILKLEAEGFEPEVLEGASELLKRTSFVATDFGFERGKQEVSTAVAGFALLTKAGFEFFDYPSQKWPSRFLFRNQVFSDWPTRPT
jgi:FkbM family methyltransferase